MILSARVWETRAMERIHWWASHHGTPGDGSIEAWGAACGITEDPTDEVFLTQWPSQLECRGHVKRRIVRRALQRLTSDNTLQSRGKGRWEAAGGG